MSLTKDHSTSQLQAELIENLDFSINSNSFQSVKTLYFYFLRQMEDFGERLAKVENTLAMVEYRMFSEIEDRMEKMKSSILNEIKLLFPVLLNRKSEDNVIVCIPKKIILYFNFYLCFI
jgi:hypothetical protein